MDVTQAETCAGGINEEGIGLEVSQFGLFAKAELGRGFANTKDGVIAVWSEQENWIDGDAGAMGWCGGRGAEGFDGAAGEED